MNLRLRTIVTKRFYGAEAVVKSLDGLVDHVSEICDKVITSLRAGGTIYTAGNGGSAAEALHLAEELIGRYRSNRLALRAMCLNADATALTCIANDFGFEHVFSRQCEALLQPNDLLFVFSTSGGSENLISALNVARARGCASIALLGRSGGRCKELASKAVVVATEDTGHIQEAHQVILHAVCEAVEEAFS